MPGYRQHSAYHISLNICPPCAPFTADDSQTARVNLGADEGLLLFVVVILFSRSENRKQQGEFIFVVIQVECGGTSGLDTPDHWVIFHSAFCIVYCMLASVLWQTMHFYVLRHNLVLEREASDFDFTSS